jgi:RNA polymerase sigma factor (sigma-70 family)
LRSVADVITPQFSPEFEAIFQEHYDLVYRTAYGVTGSVEDAQDVAQTIFLRVFRREVPVNSMKNPAGYMYRAAVNLSLTLLRSQKRRISEVDYELVKDSIPETKNQAEEEHRRLYRAIAELPPRAAEVLILRYQEELSDVEIARLLETSRGVVAVTLYRARKRLKRILSEGAE